MCVGHALRRRYMGYVTQPTTQCRSEFEARPVVTSTYDERCCYEVRRQFRHLHYVGCMYNYTESKISTTYLD
jgi:hypothetical protein